MSKTLLNLLAVAIVFWVSRAHGDETNGLTNSLPSQANTDAVNALLQIQAQLHETQMSVESNRQQTVVALARNADALVTDIRMLEKNIAVETESAQRVEQTMLIVALVGVLALAVVVTMVFLQLRTATKLIELAMSTPPSGLNSGRALPVVETPAALPPSARAALEFSNARLLGVIERLEKRILELEHSARIPLEGNHSHATISETPDQRRMTDLIVEGQLFLDTNKPEKAISCFDAALEMQPGLAEALIKKAAALEKMEKTDEAIACYDRAIESEDSATTALLQKGGLLNRLSRYEEALQCYERALQTQEKKAAEVG
ncbi:MAG TPA: tetratricopeptide repeat protein [Candidatus Acidoferrales bacterium]|jgi:tetratricopeptide (TPR) repeat protein|nr:tetratricopeptide repeat protein [Candidatus Acidoferrales bacterium]